MLSEAFIASSLTPPKPAATNSTLLKDGGIFIHSFQPLQTLRTTFKNSCTKPNCLAVSASHIFAAQAGKATVHVYSREKGNQEATIAFPDRITSLVLGCEDSVLVIGCEGGSIILWELCTGRQVSTPASHLQSVTVLAVDYRSNFLLSGSLDSVIHVWSLLDLLSFRPAHRTFQHDPRVPRLTFSNHRGSITSLVIGHSGSFLNYAVSVANDNTAMVWSLFTGDLLQTFLLPTKPLCLVLDPADRACFIGYEDGTVQVIDFFALQSGMLTSTLDLNLATTPVQPQPSSRWTSPLQAIGAASCITISYDGTVLLTGHSSGLVAAWEIGSRRFASVVADLDSASITNLNFLPPSGFPNPPQPEMKIQNVVKPLPFENSSFSSGRIPQNYHLTAQFPTNLDIDSRYPFPEKGSDNERALNYPSFPASLLEDSILEISRSGSGNSPTADLQERSAEADDFMKIDGSAQDLKSLEIKRLREQVAHLKKVQETSFAQISGLKTEQRELRKDIEEGSRRRLEKLKRREERAEREWAALGNGALNELPKISTVQKASSDRSESSREQTSGEE